MLPSSLSDDRARLGSGSFSNRVSASGVNMSAADRPSVWEAYRPVFERSLGLNPDEVFRLLQDPTIADENILYERVRELPSWQAKFGNVMDARDKAGLPYMGEGEIISQRDTYRQLLEPLGVDSERYADDWLASGTSPTEVAGRIDIASQWANNQDPETLSWLRDNYGVGKKELTGYILDNKGDRSVAWFTDQLAASQIGGEAERYGTSIGKKFADDLVDRGVSRQAARTAFAQADAADDLLDRYAAFGGGGGFKQKELAFLGSFDPNTGQFSGAGLPGSKKQMAKAKRAEARAKRLVRADQNRWSQQSAGKSSFGGGTAGNAF